MSEFLPFLVIGLVSGSIYGLAAVGLVLTYRTSGIFNFAHGSVAAIGAYTFYQLRDLNGLPAWLAFVVSVFVAGPLVGLFFEALARRLGPASVVTRVVATLGILVAVQQIAVIRYGAVSREFPPFLPTGTIEIGGVFVEIGQIIVMVVALIGTVGLSIMLRTTRLGRAMRGVVDNTELVALTGTSPASVRRLSWVIGCVFASLSGVLIAPTINLDAGILTLLVVQTFGAAAIGLFTSLPLTYAGGLFLGLAAALSTKYVGEITFVNLSGLPPSLPFVVLFAVLVFAKKGRLVDIAPDRRPPVRQRPPLGRQARITLGIVGVAALAAVPHLVGTRLLLYMLLLSTALIFLSLALLERLSGQLSLAQLTFAAVGGTTAAHAVAAGWPFLLALLAAALVAVPVGAVLAVPAIRLSGLYLALATLGFALVMEQMVFRTPLMFGTGTSDNIAMPRPTFAEGDTAYYYLVLVVVCLVCIGVIAVRQSRLGRLLRAMADSPTALATHGMSTTVLKVIVFCISAAIAGLAGALAGPVTEQVTGGSYTTFASLLLVVVLALQGPLSDVPASFTAAASITVIPSYLLDTPVHDYLPVVFGLAAVLVAVQAAGAGQRQSSDRHASANLGASDRLSRSPVRARLLEREVLAR